MAQLKRRRSVVAEADELVPIATACRLIGMDVPDEATTSKLHCPFGALWHSDHGAQATMRIYPDANHAHCFSRCGHFGPVGLFAMARGIPRRAAAIELLAHIGRARPSLADAWAQAIEVDRQPNRILLAEALKTFCARVCADWDEAQFHPAVAARLTRCLALLDLVCQPADAQLWLDGCKKAMTSALTRVQERR